MKKSPLALRFLDSIIHGIQLLLQGHFREVWDQFMHRIHSTTCSVGLRRDLKQWFDNPEAAVDITVRPMRPGDAGKILDHPMLARKFPRLVRQRYDLIEADIPTAWVAVAEGDDPCYMQWLIGAEHNERMLEYFDGEFPSLDEDEALLEAAFMNPDYRGKNIMPAAMSRIAEKAGELGARWVVTFVDMENIPSLKGCKRAGFSPYIVRKDQWFLFTRRISYESIHEQVVKEYRLVTA